MPAGSFIFGRWKELGNFDISAICLAFEFLYLGLYPEIEPLLNARGESA